MADIRIFGIKKTALFIPGKIIIIATDWKTVVTCSNNFIIFGLQYRL